MALHKAVYLIAKFGRLLFWRQLDPVLMTFEYTAPEATTGQRTF